MRKFFICHLPLITFLTLFGINNSHAQKRTRELDSLYTVLATVKEDTNKVGTIGLIIQRNISLGNYEDAKHYNLQMLALSKKLNYTHGVYTFYFFEGFRMYKEENYKGCIESYAKCAAYYEK